MKKFLITAIMIVMTLSLVACGMNNTGNNSENNSFTGSNRSDSNSSDNGNTGTKTNEDYYFNATVLEISNGKMTVKPDKNSKNKNTDEKLMNSEKITVDAGILEKLGLKDIKAGDKIRIVYDKNTISDDYSKIDTVFTYYRIDENGDILKNE